MDRFDVSGDYSGSYVEIFVKGGCSLWWKRKKKDFGGRKNDLLQLVLVIRGRRWIVADRWALDKVAP